MIILEKLNSVTGEWDVIAFIPDSPSGGTYNPGPCSDVDLYRITQLATNEVDKNESNSLYCGKVLDCSPASIHLGENANKKQLISVFDALGREVSQAKNQILFHIYDDGSVEKKFVVE